MNIMKEIQRINQKELEQGLDGTENSSWHAEYKNSAVVYVGGLDDRMTEGDVLTIVSQYGEPSDIALPKNKEDKKKNRGFAFVSYEDQRSTILAVDNLNGARVLNRTLRVDHKKDYTAFDDNDNKKSLTDIRKEKMKVFEKELIAKYNEEHKQRKKAKKADKNKEKEKQSTDTTQGTKTVPPPPATNTTSTTPHNSGKRRREDHGEDRGGEDGGCPSKRHHRSRDRDHHHNHSDSHRHREQDTHRHREQDAQHSMHHDRERKEDRHRDRHDHDHRGGHGNRAAGRVQCW